MQDDILLNVKKNEIPQKYYIFPGLIRKGEKMKRLLVVCILALTLIESLCFAIEYCKDVLEQGNLEAG